MTTTESEKHEHGNRYKTREPTGGLEPLTCSLRVSCSLAEGAAYAMPPSLGPD